MVRVFTLGLLGLLLCANGATAELDLRVERLRNTKGVLQICLTRQAEHFPDCTADPHRISRTLPATAGLVRISGLVPGAYAVSVFHDENANRKLDMLLAIPREGFAFSRNPVVRFSAPKFRQVVIDLAPGISLQRVRMQYIL